MKRRRVLPGPMKKVLREVIEFNRKHKADNIYVSFCVSGEDTYTSLTLFNAGRVEAIKHLWEDDFFDTVNDLEKWAKEKIPA